MVSEDHLIDDFNGVISSILASNPSATRNGMSPWHCAHRSVGRAPSAEKSPRRPSSTRLKAITCGSLIRDSKTSTRPRKLRRLRSCAGWALRPWPQTHCCSTAIGAGI